MFWTQAFVFLHVKFLGTGLFLKQLSLLQPTNLLVYNVLQLKV